jgi:dienelactone hydrolase
MKTVVVVMLGMLLVASSVSGQGLPDPVVYPAPTGEYAVGRIDTVWVDASREEIFTDAPDDVRHVPASIWYPAADDAAPLATWIDPALAGRYAEATGVPLDTVISLITVHARSGAAAAPSDTPFPVLIMSHGSGLFPALYTSTAESLASHGYVVIGVTHPYNAAAALLADGTLALPAPAAAPDAPNIPADSDPLTTLGMIDAHAQPLLSVQVGDLRFALDQAERLNADDPALAGRLDLARVGVFGHSFGGAAAIETVLADDRFGAAALIDGSLFSDMSAGSDRPVLALFADATLNGMDEAEAEALEMSAAVLNAADLERFTGMLGRVRRLVQNSPDSALVTIAGAEHMNFSDAGALNALLDGIASDLGAIDSALALEITNAYLLAFFDETLRGAASQWDTLATLYPETTVEYHE